MTTLTAWNVETLGQAVEGITGEGSAAVSWADAAGAAISRAGRKRKPPQLVVGVCVRDDDTEARVRELPGFVRLSSREDTDIDDEPIRVLRAVFTREGGGDA